ncbi:hypothetical protein Tco_1323589 [Tanacetum coccineum]
MGMFIQTPAEDAEETEGALQLGPERARVFTDLSAEEKERYKADIRATNILLQGIPKDIYTLINPYTDAKDIWDNVKIILEGSELTKDDRESQLYDEFERFLQIKERPFMFTMNNATVQDGRVVVQDVRGRYNANNQGRPFQRNTARENVVARNAGGQNRDGNVNLGQAKPIMIQTTSKTRWCCLKESNKQVTNFDDDVDDLALNVDHVFEADQCDAFNSDVDEGPVEY